MHEGIHADAHILIVDDEPANVAFVERLLHKEGYQHCKSTSDPRQALPLALTFQPDLLILDLHMPHLDGFEVMQQLTTRRGDNASLPILVVSGDLTSTAKRQALSLGATDFLTKPFDAIELLLRVKNQLLTRRLHLQLQRENHRLEERVRERTHQLQAAEFGALRSLALAAEFRDDQTGAHAQRVGQVAAAIARELSWPEDQVTLLRHAAPLHDVGKIGLPDAILLKASPLTGEELAVMRTHTTIGATILSISRTSVLQCAEVIALTHHERWDGTGYPTGLAGDDIPMPGRVVAVADVFDAMTHPRTYKEGWPVAITIERISNLAGQQFDPVVVEAFRQMASKIPGSAPTEDACRVGALTR